MKAICLFCVLVVAHILMVFGRSIPVSIWTPVSFLWPDAAAALLFGILDWGLAKLKWPHLGWILYAVLVGYISINVAVARILSSPLTWTMIHAARGPLRDSITHYFVISYLMPVVVTGGCGVLFPALFVRSGLRPGRALRTGLILAAAGIVSIGPYAGTKLATVGMERNAFGALWPARTSGTAGNSSSPWRSSPFDSTPGSSFASFRGAGKGRNVVLILLESAAAQYLKPYGAVEDPMPNLTRLAAESIVFDKAYAVYPESIRELFAALCSRYPIFGAATESYAAVPCSSLGEILHDAGYRTALFHSGRFMYLGMQSVIEKRGFDTLEDAGAIGGNINSSFGVDEPAAVSRILSWIDSTPAGQPFFVTYIPVAGHHPYATPEAGPFPGDSDLNQYRNALHYGDESLGTLFAGLRQRALDRNTLYVIFGDHGEAFGQHDGNYGHSLFVYDENIRVPYIIAGPGLIRQSFRSSAVASVIDTAPTILDILGLPAPSGFQGESLLQPAQQMALFFTDYSLGFLGLRDGCWKYIFETGSAHSKLFDACEDPGELRDLSSKELERVNAYRSKVEGWISAAGAVH